MKKNVIITLSYALFSFICCLAVSLIMQRVPDVLPGARTNYMVVRALLFFFEIFPALIFCGFLVGCAISYGRDSKKAKMKYSICIMEHFRKTMIFSIVLTFLVTFVSEFFIPYFQNVQKREELKPSVFNDFMILANEYYEAGDMNLAYEYSYNAVEINPKDSKAIWLKEHSEAAINSMKEYKVKAEEPKFVYVPIKESKGETVYSLIQKARTAAEGGDWFNAHYYAYMAVKIGNSKDINLDEAQRLSSEAWNHLFDTKIFRETEDQMLFRKKRSAYMNFINGDNIEAYYQFLEISKTGDKAARDPDVSKFLKIAEERVNEQCFFIEEVEDLKRFEVSKNVYFAITHDDGAKDVVYICGITPVKNSGRMVQYLRGFTMLSFDKDGLFKQSIKAPYAKVLSQTVASFDEDSKAEFGLKEEFKSVPYLMLESITHNERKDRLTPVYEFDAELEKSGEALKNYTVLGVSMNDFNLICDAGIGSGDMNVISLIKLLSKARNFGFPWVVYNADFLNRVTYPLIILVAFIFFASVAWNYRLQASLLFKFKWVFIMPLISFAAYFIMECLLYAYRLLNFMLVCVAKEGALFVSLGILIAALIATSFNFVSKTGE